MLKAGEERSTVSPHRLIPFAPASHVSYSSGPAGCPRRRGLASGGGIPFSPQPGPRGTQNLIWPPPPGSPSETGALPAAAARGRPDDIPLGEGSAPSARKPLPRVQAAHAGSHEASQGKLRHRSPLRGRCPGRRAAVAGGWPRRPPGDTQQPSAERPLGCDRGGPEGWASAEGGPGVASNHGLRKKGLFQGKA